MEDMALHRSIELATVKGENWTWREIAAGVGGRNGRQCRQRYEQYLSPGIVRGEWTEEEDARLGDSYEEYGPKWAHLSRTFFPGRSSQAVKNRWNHHVRGSAGARASGRSGVRRPECGPRMRAEPAAPVGAPCGIWGFVSVTSDGEFLPVSEVEIWTDEEENMVDIIGFGI
jgi:hypothetical protein